MKYLFIASIATAKNHFDGERNKSKAVLDCLKKLGIVKSVNLSSKVLQPLNMLRFIFYVMIFKPNKIFICKAPSGGSIVLGLLRKLRFPSKDIVFYSYGRGLHNFENKVKKINLLYAGTLICEAPEISLEFKEYGFSNIEVFPCVKKYYQINQPAFFTKKRILRVLFFSRVTPEKGVFDAINSISRLNQDSIHFSLTIAGACESIQVKKTIEQICKTHPYIKFVGTSFSITGMDSYLEFSTYDLLIFPSSFFHECAPGSVVDSLIAGVPVLSTEFLGYKQMLDSSFAYLLNDTQPTTIDKALQDIYDKPEDLFKKRVLCTQKARQYSYESFTAFLKTKIFPN